MTQDEQMAASTAGHLASYAAKRGGLPDSVAAEIARAVEGLIGAIFSHSDPAALARDLAAEAAHRVGALAAVQAALDLKGHAGG